MNRLFLSSVVSSMYLYSEGLQSFNDVVITATKTENSAKELTTAVQIISVEQIENSGASNLSEILSSVAGVYINPSGSTYRIRGMEHADTLILIDGRRVNGEFSKIFELERIAADMIERVEILKGTSSLLYGSDAMGGVINIITKKATKDKLRGSIQVIGGEYKRSADFIVSKKFKDTSFTLFTNYINRDSYSKDKVANIKIMHSGVEKSPSNSTLPATGNYGTLASALSDSYSVNNDYLYNLEVKNIGTKISHNLNDAISLYFDFSYLEEEKDGEYISDSYATAYAGGSGNIMTKYVPAHQYNKNKRLDIASGLDYFINDNMHLNYNIAYSRYKKDRKSYTPLYSQLGYSSYEASAFSVNESVIKYLNNNLQFTHTISENNRYILGAEHRINDTTSTAFNVNNRTYTSFFAQHEYDILKNLKLIYGARYDKTSIDEDEVSFSFGGVYRLTNNLFLKANYSEGFRSPDDRELYVDQTTPTGKKKLGAEVIDSSHGKTSQYKLKSEKSKSFEVGLLADFDIADFEINAYQTDVDDRISEVTYSNYTSFENISDTKIRGVESALSFSPLEDFYIDMSFAYVDAKNEIENKELVEIPKSIAGLTLKYKLTKSVELKTITKYVGEQYSSDEVKLGGYTITNLKLNVTNIMKDTDFFVGVDNIFDKQMDDYLGLIPQSNFYAGIKYKF
ncbi:TonB-dependent receptor [Halarcobacter ebronensis]|uniref:TonB-dependent receptor n=1 Tax=Halarcobacter ebronensis TaxID=1462615 RepID=A0A4Q1AM15_9BACT|nr:TonB-dependent receptor [Halarcobacter ebronensis]